MLIAFTTVSPIRNPIKGRSLFLPPLLHKYNEIKNIYKINSTLNNSFVVPSISIIKKRAKLTNYTNSKKEKHIGNSYIII